MENTSLVQHNFNTEQKELLCSIINRFGDGQHPVADMNTVDYFKTSYLKDVLTTEKFISSKSKLSDMGSEILLSIYTILY